MILHQIKTDDHKFGEFIFTQYGTKTLEDKSNHNIFGVNTWTIDGLLNLLIKKEKEKIHQCCENNNNVVLK